MTMLSADIEAFGVVREPGQAPYPAFCLAVAQPGAAPWVVYRRPAAFRALADRLRGLLSGLPPYPATAFPYDGAATSPVAGVAAVVPGGGMEMSQENLHHARTQLQAWLQHALRLYPSLLTPPKPLVGGVDASPALPLRAFLLEGANLCPPYFEMVWGSHRARSLGGSASDGSAGGEAGAGVGAGKPKGNGEEEDDDMDMDDLFQGRHTEQDLGEQDLDDDEEGDHLTGLPSAGRGLGHGGVGVGGNKGGFQEEEEDDEDDEAAADQRMFSQSAPLAEAVFYNSDMDDDSDDDVGGAGNGDGSGLHAQPQHVHSHHPHTNLGSSSGLRPPVQQAAGDGGFGGGGLVAPQPQQPGYGAGAGISSSSMRRLAAMNASGGIGVPSAMGGGRGDSMMEEEEEEGKSSRPVPSPPSAPHAGGCAACHHKQRQRASLDSFKLLKVIGKGSFGKVFLVRERHSGKIYAMKVLNKSNIIKRNQVEHTRTERNVLGYIKHPFIVGLNMAFQTKDKLFFVLDYCAGGELFFHLGKMGKFPEPRARFYSAEITLALEHIHKLDIVYRDLKPENVLLDARGHVRLTDFGLSKEGITDNTSGAHSFCGTPEYLAPEILNRQGHGRAVDWWSLGALLYEMLTGLPPFYCRDREKLFEKIRTAELTFPKFVSAPARSVLSGLLTRDPTKRLGSGETDAEEIKSHPFFAEIDWTLLLKGHVPPPWEPTVCGSLDTSQFDKEFTSMPIFSPADHNSLKGSALLQQHGQHGMQGAGQAGSLVNGSHLAHAAAMGARFGATPADDGTFAGFTFTDDSLQVMQAGMQALRGGGSTPSDHHHHHHHHHHHFHH